MTSTEIIDHISGLETTCKTLQEKLKEMQDRTTKQADRFYAAAMTTEEVAKLHDVSPARVRDYATRGLIELHPNSTDAKLLFRASTALTLDFTDLRKAKSTLKR